MTEPASSAEQQQRAAHAAIISRCVAALAGILLAAAAAVAHADPEEVLPHELSAGVELMHFAMPDRNIDDLAGAVALAFGPFRARAALSTGARVSAQLALDFRGRLGPVWLAGGPALLTAAGFGSDEPRTGGPAFDLRVGRGAAAVELVVRPPLLRDEFDPRSPRWFVELAVVIARFTSRS